MRRLGLGLGWRPELALFIDRHERLEFVEVVAENVSREPPAALDRLLERGVAIVPHAVSLSLGGAEPPDPARLRRLRELARRLRSPVVSEHAAFVRGGGMEAGHLLPIPRTRRMLQVFCENVRRAQDALEVPLAIENVAALFEWPGAEMDEADFLAEALHRTGALLLLDVANLYANARNHGWDAGEFLDRLPLDRLAYVHVAGGTERGGLYHDTHAHALGPGPLALLESLASRAPLPGVMLERDDAFPQASALEEELDSVGRASVPVQTNACASRPPLLEIAFDSRYSLAQEQAALVASLLDETTPPAGFDARRVAAASHALVQKKQRSLRRRFPRLCEALGEQLPGLARAFHRSDAEDFCAFLRSHGLLPDEGRLEMMARSRRPFEVAWLPRMRRLVLRVSLPGLGTRWWSLGATGILPA